MTDLKPDIQASLDFLNWLAPDDEIILTAIQPDQPNSVEGTTIVPSRDIEKATKWLTRLGGVKNIYFTVARCLRPLEGRGAKAKKTDVRGLSFLHVDIDPRHGEDPDLERERAIRRLKAYKLPPSCIINSGGGVQAFWRLDQEHVTNGDEQALIELEGFNVFLSKEFGADHCHNGDRIMRLPGTLNLPDAKKQKKGRVVALAHTIEQDDSTYQIGQFGYVTLQQRGITPAAAAGPQTTTAAPKPVRPEKDLIAGLGEAVKTIIQHGEDPENPARWESRSQCVFWVAMRLVEAGLTDDEGAAIFLNPEYGISASVIDKGSGSTRYAGRQMKRARQQIQGGDYSNHLQDLNQKHFVCFNFGKKFRVFTRDRRPETPEDDDEDRVPYVDQSKEDFMARYQNVKLTVGRKQVPLGEWWLNHPLRRSYEKVIFEPERDEPDCFNVWRGWAIQPVPGKCDLWLYHLREVLCAGDEVNYQYLLNWFALMFQHPGRAGQVAVILKGKKGAGKGTVAVIMRDIIGDHMVQLVDAEHLVGKFNAHLRQAVVVFADEAFYAGDRRHIAVLQAMITEPTLRTEPKGVDSVESKNYIHLIMAADQEWVVPAGDQERRYFVLDVSDHKMQDTGYFEALLREMQQQGGNAAFLDMMLKRDLSEFQVRHVPKTKGLQNQQDLSLSADQSWWREKLELGELLRGTNVWCDEVQYDSLKDEYFETAQRQRFARPLTSVALGKFIRSMMPESSTYQKRVTKTVNRGDSYEDGKAESVRVLYLKVPSLYECRQAWKKRWGGPPEWDVREDDQQLM